MSQPSVIGWIVLEGKTNVNKARAQFRTQKHYTGIYNFWIDMVNSCAVPFCTNRYRAGSAIRFYRLPLKKPKLFRIWLQRIRCESIPINECTRVCSDHFRFSGSPKKRLGTHDVPSVFAWSKATNPRPTKGRVTENRQEDGIDSGNTNTGPESLTRATSSLRSPVTCSTPPPVEPLKHFICLLIPH